MAEPFVLADESYFIIESWKDLNPNIIAGFTTMNNRSSLSINKNNNLGLHVGDDPNHVVNNRKMLADAIQFPLSQWVCLEQTHGNNVQCVTQSHWGSGSLNYENSIKDCDGIYSDQSGTLLALVYADCVPIYFYAPKEQLIGIVHAGWKGTVKKIVHSLLREWQSLGIDLTSIHACIGPSICDKCYIVDDKVIHEVDKMKINNHESFYNQISEGQYKLDLKSLNKALLSELGLREQQITVSNFCTSCHDTRFFSHRRDNGRTGRMIGFIGIKERIRP